VDDNLEDSDSEDYIPFMDELATSAERIPTRRKNSLTLKLLEGNGMDTTQASGNPHTNGSSESQGSTLQEDEPTSPANLSSPALSEIRWHTKPSSPFSSGTVLLREADPDLGQKLLLRYIILALRSGGLNTVFFFLRVQTKLTDDSAGKRSGAGGEAKAARGGAKRTRGPMGEGRGRPQEASRGTAQIPHQLVITLVVSGPQRPGGLVFHMCAGIAQY